MNQGTIGAVHVTFHSAQTITESIMHEMFLYIIDYKHEINKVLYHKLITEFVFS